MSGDSKPFQCFAPCLWTVKSEDAAKNDRRASHCAADVSYPRSPLTPQRWSPCCSNAEHGRREITSMEHKPKDCSCELRRNSGCCLDCCTVIGNGGPRERGNCYPSQPSLTSATPADVSFLSRCLAERNTRSAFHPIAPFEATRHLELAS